MSQAIDHDEGPSRRTEYGSCFFLSYAHTPRVFQDGPDLNYWVREFFRDLCNELVSCDPRWHRPDGQGLPGFMDEEIREGRLWRRRLVTELATCRVFIPLYCGPFFASENCGKEWAIFRARQMAHMAQTGQPNEAILPVIWKPVRGELPPFATAPQMERLGAADAYFERGLYELIRLDRDRAYTSVVLRLAERLDEAARNAAPPPGPPADFDAMHPMFPLRGESGSPEPGEAGERRLRITVAAPHLLSMPPGRDRLYYGARGEDWRPYQPQSSVPLASRVEDVARGLGYTPQVSTLNGTSPELHEPGSDGRPADPADGPTLLLVDPWVAHTDMSESVKAVDGRRKGWVRVLVPWSLTDTQTAEQAPVLRSLLERLLPWSLAEWSRTAPAATRELATVSDFGHTMPEVVELAWRSYRRAVRSGAGRGYPLRPLLREPGEGAGPASGSDIAATED
ncbi:MAG: hypothetical protein HOV87_30445 [Catenulispora sp.]|nr:hypothetical protein [Catenulispora sp.]